MRWRTGSRSRGVSGSCGKAGVCLFFFETFFCDKALLDGLFGFSTWVVQG